MARKNDSNDTRATDDGHAVENIRTAVAETNALNTLSQPLGYAVTCDAGGGVGTDQPAYRHFTVHRIDHPVAHGPTFDTADDVRRHLNMLEKLPCWRLDLDDDSVEFDTVNLTITDKVTGESFCLKGWKSFGLNGVLTGDERRDGSGSARYILVAAAERPRIGRWYRADTH